MEQITCHEMIIDLSKIFKCINCLTLANFSLVLHTRDVFYVRGVVDLMKTATVNAYIIYIFGKIELLSIHAI